MGFWSIRPAFHLPTYPIKKTFFCQLIIHRCPSPAQENGLIDTHTILERVFAFLHEPPPPNNDQLTKDSVIELQIGSRATCSGPQTSPLMPRQRLYAGTGNISQTTWGNSWILNRLDSVTQGQTGMHLALSVYIFIRVLRLYSPSPTLFPTPTERDTRSLYAALSFLIRVLPLLDKGKTAPSTP